MILVLSVVLMHGVFAQAGPVKVGSFDYVGEGNPRQFLDLYLPENKEGKMLPAILWIHGGAWLQGSKEKPGKALQAARSGEFAVVSINYRLSQEAKWPAQIHDCKAALRWVKAHAEEHHLDPERIIVWGASAGGQLVTMLGTTQDDPKFEGKLGKHLDQSSKVKAFLLEHGLGQKSDLRDTVVK